ncbi:glycosyltransferase [Falsiroseomonas sp.]|uniref:glycosyltransferase n=1 Tax=Falsiroseomonas sp. TaxID=2870721 RepID=UPI00356A037B
MAETQPAPRILFLDHTAVLGGGELSLLDIAGRYRGRCRVLLLADGPFRTRLEAEGVEVEVLDARAGLAGISRAGGLIADLRALPGVAALARAVARRAAGFDLLYANSQKSMVIAGLAGRLARRPVIWHLRDLMSAEHFSALHRRLAAVAARLLTSRVIANSAATRRAFIEGGAPAGRVHVVHNGIDAGRFLEVPDEQVAALRASLGLAGLPVVGLFSRLAPWKGQHVLLEALAELPGVHGLFVGEALFEGDRSYAGELRARARSLGLEGRTHFLGFRQDIPCLLRLCDVLAHTSVAPEPFGRVIVEGMLAGRPVVATRAGGALEIIEDGETGRLTPPGDAAALAAALRSLLDDPNAARALAARGRSAAQQRFSLEAMLSGVERQVADVTAHAVRRRGAGA